MNKTLPAAVLGRRATCCILFGPLRRRVEGGVGHQLEWRVCRFCGTEFGPVWPEHQWPDPSSEPNWTTILAMDTGKTFREPGFTRVEWSETSAEGEPLS